MTVTDPAITLQVKEDDEVLEPYSWRSDGEHASQQIVDEPARERLVGERAGKQARR
jgi:hypothetical protein